MITKQELKNKLKLLRKKWEKQALLRKIKRIDQRSLKYLKFSRKLLARMMTLRMWVEEDAKLKKELVKKYLKK